MELREAVELVDELLRELGQSGKMDVLELAALLREVVDVFRESIPSDDEDDE